MSKTVIVAPMNWGLGHATRSIPVINEFLRQGANVHIASDGVALKLLRTYFPELPWHELPGYNVNYPKGNFAWHMVRQGFKVLGAYYGEKKEIRKIAEKYKAWGVVSDHRLGCRVPGLRNAIIAHMVKLSPVGPWPGLLQWLHYRHLKLFQYLWVPDVKEAPGLSGTALGHGKWKHPQQRYVGPLTRMRAGKTVPIVTDLIAVLSGPEPARTLFEGIVLQQMADMPDKRFTLVSGLPGEANKLENIPANVVLHNALHGEDLQNAIDQADMMLSRSGYSTILDLTMLKKKAFFVPTPGQPEQEMLAVDLEKRGFFGYTDQHNFSLEKAMASKDHYTGFSLLPDQRPLLVEAVKEFLKD